MSRYVVDIIDPGCDCCSYVQVAAYDREEDIPDEYRTADYSIYDFGDDDG